MRSLATSRRGPQALCRALACCGAADLAATETFQNFSRPHNFSSEIARDRAEIHADWWCAALPRAAEVPKHGTERRHPVARRISPRMHPNAGNVGNVGNVANAQRWVPSVGNAPDVFFFNFFRYRPSCWLLQESNLARLKAPAATTFFFKSV